MTDIVIAGIGQTPVGEHWEISLRELAYQAISQAIDDAQGLQPQSLIVANVFAPQLSNQAHLGALIADFSGFTGIEAFSVESGEASGGAALRSGYMMIASKLVDVVLVVGVEKITEKSSTEQEAIISTILDSDFEGIHGITPTSQAAMLMRRYLYEHSLPRNVFAGFPINAHANALNNPNAMMPKAIHPDLYEKANLVCDPLNIFDVAPWADGAAALILTRPELLPPGFPHRLVKISGSSFCTDHLAVHDRRDPLFFKAAHLSVERACLKANVNKQQIDLFEPHDSYSIYSALALEAAGFAPRGEGWKLSTNDVQLSDINKHRSLPISTFGGLKARGNPGGATGIYQAAEAVLQLRQEAKDNQINYAQIALIQNISGAASSVASHILEALD